MPPYLGRDRTADGAVLVVAFVDQETRFTFTMSINRKYRDEANANMAIVNASGHHPVKRA